MKTVIVGVNHGRIAAANILLDYYPDHRVVMIDQNTDISCLGCGTALQASRQIGSYQDLFYTRKEDFEKKGASIHMETTIRKIDFERKVVFYEKADGGIFEESYDKLIPAAGSLPIAPNLPGQNLKHIGFLKLFQDGRNVDHLTGRMNVQHVTVIGAGYIGVKVVEAAIRRGKRVRLFNIADTSLASYCDEWFTKDMDRLLREKGIETHFKEQVLALLGTTSVKRIVTDRGEYKTDPVINAIGFKPDTVLGMGHPKLFKDGAHYVGRHQRTSDPDVYAVGDCAAIYSSALKRGTYTVLVMNAVHSGIVAGHSMGGTALEETGIQDSNGAFVFGYRVVSTGSNVKVAQESRLDVTCTDFEDLQRPGFMKKNARAEVRTVYGRNSRWIVGAQVASTEGIPMEIHMFSLAVGQEVTTDQLKLLDLFFPPRFNQPYNYITMTVLSIK